MVEVFQNFVEDFDIKTNFKTFQTVDPETCAILIFIKGSWTGFLTTFCVWFFKKNISHVTFFNWPNFFTWLSLLLEILGYMCIVIICCPVCDVIYFQINLSFLIKPFFYITKKSGQKCKYLKNEKSFKHEIKTIFHHF